jgi:hypothetical protein
MQVLEALKPLAQSIAEAGLVLEAFTVSHWGAEEAHALGSAFSGHALKRLHLRGTGRYYIQCGLEEGFLPALTTAVPALESLSLSRMFVCNGES